MGASYLQPCVKNKESLENEYLSISHGVMVNERGWKSIAREFDYHSLPHASGLVPKLS